VVEEGRETGGMKKQSGVGSSRARAGGERSYMRKRQTWINIYNAINITPLAASANVAIHLISNAPIECDSKS